VIQNPQDWHRRYLQQAGWTTELRQFLYTKAMLAHAQRILDVGCGTGALTPELHSTIHGSVIGLDLSYPNLAFAKNSSPQGLYTQGNAYDLPFPSNSFDTCLCHFLLLWLSEPLKALVEMARVLRQSGYLLILAEPDYDGRIDYPRQLSVLGNAQIHSLKRQGANPAIGRSLADLLQQAGLTDIETGVLGGQWKQPSNDQDWKTEWEVLESDLAGLPKPITKDLLEKLRQVDYESTRRGIRILYVPTFYALGKKP
jgi:SAM-dependent methyltransferase